MPISLSSCSLTQSVHIYVKDTLIWILIFNFSSVPFIIEFDLSHETHPTGLSTMTLSKLVWLLSIYIL